MPVLLQPGLEVLELLDLLLYLGDLDLQVDCFGFVGVEGQRFDLLLCDFPHGFEDEILRCGHIEVVGHVGDLQGSHLQDAADRKGQHYDFSLLLEVYHWRRVRVAISGFDVDQTVDEVDRLERFAFRFLVRLFLVEVDADSVAPVD